MSDFERVQPPVRLAEIHQGDTLQRIAAREMGDANRWPELVWINSLSPPYLTGDERQVAPGVLMFGALIKVPAPVGVYTDSTDRGEAYARDCQLTGKMLLDDGRGDFAVASGTANLKQQLSHVISTPRGQATRHPNYGCLVWRLQGTVNGPVAAKLGAEYVKSALLSDYRVSSVASSVADASGDVLQVVARAIAIDGSAVDLVLGAVDQPIIEAGKGYGNNYGMNWGN